MYTDVLLNRVNKGDYDPKILYKKNGKYYFIRDINDLQNVYIKITWNSNILDNSFAVGKCVNGVYNWDFAEMEAYISRQEP